jgi:glycerophosphoryl diester phosphodiesterase
VAGAHARGRQIFVYTVNDSAEMRRLFELGVDGLFTDDPAQALEILTMK